MKMTTLVSAPVVLRVVCFSVILSYCWQNVLAFGSDSCYKTVLSHQGMQKTNLVTHVSWLELHEHLYEQCHTNEH